MFTFANSHLCEEFIHVISRLFQVDFLIEAMYPFRVDSRCRQFELLTALCFWDGATVTIVDQTGFARTVTTSSFGYYNFDDIASGATYTIGVASRQYRFASRTLKVADNLTDVDFVGLE